MKKIFFTFFFILSLLGGAYYYLEVSQNSKISSLWAMVPSNAVYVYETNNPIPVWNDLEQKPAWSNLYDITFFKNLKQNLELLDSLSGKNGSLDKLLRKKQILISAHIISSDGFDHVFYAQFSSPEEKKIAGALLKAFHGSNHLITEKRLFNGIFITEVMDKKKNISFAYIHEGDFFAGSFTPYLIEDVVRSIAGNEKESFAKRNSKLFELARMDNDEGNLYVDMAGLAQLGMMFSDNKEDERLKTLNTFARSSFLDITINDHEFLLTGFTVPAQRRDFIQTFHGQRPGRLDMRNYIPVRTALFYHLTFHDPRRWSDSLHIYRLEYEKGYKERREALQAEIKIDPAVFYEWIDGEVGLFVLESVDVANPEQVLLVKMKDIDKALSSINDLSSLISLSFNDSVYVESYANTEIRQLKIQELPEKLFGNMFSGFPTSFYSFVGNYLVIGNKISSVKDALFEIESENTWGRSVKHNLFLEGLIQESNISVVINTNRFWNTLNSKVSPKWKEVMDKWYNPLRRYELAAVQVVSMDDKFYTSIDVKFNPEQVHDRQFPELNIEAEINNAKRIITKPLLVKNPVSGGFDFLYQDADFVLRMVSADGSLIWSDSIGESVVGKIHIIESVSKEKQFLFITEKKLHLINSKGDYLAPFPVAVPEKTTFQYLSLVDYDKSKNYRFFTASREGNLYLFDKKGELLSGWNPKKLDYKLSQAPFHFRGGNRDCMIAIQENGLVNVMNRKGEMLHGFPLNLQSKITSPVFIEQGSSLATTNLTILNQEGEIIVLNLEGKVQRREQLYRPSKETSFMLIPDALERTYVIARQERNRLSLLNRKGVPFFEKDFITSDLLNLQYYDFGAGNELFVVNDIVQEYSYIFNSGGTLINQRPFESGFDVSILFSEFQNKFTLYKAYDSQIQAVSFPR